MHLINVDLPEPDGPQMNDPFRRGDCQIDVLERVKASYHLLTPSMRTAGSKPRRIRGRLFAFRVHPRAPFLFASVTNSGSGEPSPLLVMALSFRPP